MDSVRLVAREVLRHFRHGPKMAVFAKVATRVGFCRSCSSNVVLDVQINYLLLATMMF